ncbi:MAG: biotin--[acetyl-CoA-carboxylase] ligase [Planctomycetes bacterium]|nr:biotin--[acetyl-CoA-carboxylase] ligase [Planctomycetota bacterium]
MYVEKDSLSGLALRRVGSRLEVRESVPSTMDLAWELALAGAPPGTVAVAARQTKGRGRFGRVWESPPGGLWLSVLLDHPGEAYPAGAVPIAGALAIASTAAELAGLDARIRWPNDCMVAGRKFAGVLAESRRQNDGREKLVLGAGIDVNVRRESLEFGVRALATSFVEETGREFDLAAVLASFLSHLDRLLELLAAGGLAEFEKAWTLRSSTLGRRVRIETPGGARIGTVVEITLAGGITIEEGGFRKTYRGEHVSLLGELA